MTNSRGLLILVIVLLAATMCTGQRKQVPLDRWDTVITVPYGLLIVGIVLLLLAVIYTYTGKVWARSCWVYRAKEPKWFWWQIALYCLTGVGLIGAFLY